MSTETLEQKNQPTIFKEQFALPCEEEDYTQFNEEEVKQSFDVELLTTENEFDMEPDVKSSPSGSEIVLSSSIMSDSTGRYPCSNCSHKALNASALKVHIDGIHEGVRYPCEYILFSVERSEAENRCFL